MAEPLPETDLMIEKIVPVSAGFLWRGWTDPSLLVKWFTPAPWKTASARVEPWPGGVFHVEMRGPNGEEDGGIGCVIEAIYEKKFVWTSTLGPGFRPAMPLTKGFHLTAIIELESLKVGTRYRATARHATIDDARAHAEMGFETGWGAALDQLVELGGIEPPSISR